MARAVMAVYAWAPLFFIPFIVVATFTVLNLFIGIIVSTMQELATKPDGDGTEPQTAEQILTRLEPDLRALLQRLSSGPARD
jgi:voltage-gated sodium channel